VDYQEQQLISQAKLGDVEAIIQLVELWFRTGQGAAQEIPAPRYYLKIDTDDDLDYQLAWQHHPAPERFVPPFYPRAEGTLELTIFSDHEIKIKGDLSIWNQRQQQIAEYQIVATYTDYGGDGWEAYQLHGDKFIHSYSSLDLNGENEYYSEHQIVTPQIQKWVAQHPEALKAGKHYAYYQNVQQAYREVERRAEEYQAVQRQLIFEMKQFLDNVPE